MGIVRTLFRDKRFSNKSLLYTNFFSSRINEFTKHLLPYVNSYKINRVKGENGLYSSVIETNMSIWDLIRENTSIPLKQFRSKGLTDLLLMCNGKATLLDGALKLAKVLPAREILEGTGDDAEEIDSSLPLIDFEGLGNENRFKCSISTLNELVKGVFNFYKSTGLPVKRKYAIPKIERFEYTSDDGSLMFSDLLFLDRGDEHFEATKKLIRGENKQGALLMVGETEKEYMRNKREFERHVNQWSLKISPNHFYLMNLPKRKDITPQRIDKEQAIEKLRNGKSVEYIAKNFRGFSVVSLSALKEQVTADSYDLPIVQEVVREVEDVVRPLCEDHMSKLDRILERGIVYYDSNSVRLYKNVNRTDCKFPIIKTSLISGNEFSTGLEEHVRHIRGLYVLNSFDDNVGKAVDVLLSQSINSRFFYNLLFIGGKSQTINSEITAAIDLSAKIKYAEVHVNNPVIDPLHPINLDSIVLN